VLLRDCLFGSSTRTGDPAGWRYGTGLARRRSDILAFPIWNLRSRRPGITRAPRQSDRRQEGKNFTRAEHLSIVPNDASDSSRFPRSRKLNTLAQSAAPYHILIHGQNSLPLRILVAITGASGLLYAQRLLDNLDCAAHEVHIVL